MCVIFQLQWLHMLLYLLTLWVSITVLFCAYVRSDYEGNQNDIQYSMTEDRFLQVKFLF